MPRTVDSAQLGEGRPSQRGSDACPNREPVESSEGVPDTLSCTVDSRNCRKPAATSPGGGRTKAVDSEESSGTLDGGNDAESDEKETDAGVLTWVGARGASGGGDRAPFAAGGAAAPTLQRQTSDYAVHTKEEVGELMNMINAIAPTPRKTKRVYNMYVTSAEELGYSSCSLPLLRFYVLGCWVPFVELLSEASGLVSLRTCPRR